ncbi:MAG TPA: FGGY family carbohydrate kinase [Pseudomonadales bacterium]|nr:FGGY family carbohydrate kinase [Pseudomonadales bacterium]
MSPLALVLDQGGHSTRAMVFDENGALVAQASIPVNTVIKQAGWIEQDAVELVASLQSVLLQVADQLGRRCSDVQSAALIVQRSSLVAWDKLSHTILSPVLSWQDTRNSEWLEKILTDNRDSIRQSTGLYPNAHYGASKIRWLLDHLPAVNSAAEKRSLCIAPLASFLHQQLTGVSEPVVDAVIASRTMLTDIAATSWSTALLDLFGIPAAILPEIKPSLANYGVIRLGDCHVPLRLLGGDQSFFAMSHGDMFNSDAVFINAGTGAFIQQKTQPALVPDKLLCSALCVVENNSGAIIVAEGTVNAAATALDWLWKRIGFVFSAEDWNLAIGQAVSEPASVPYFINRITASGSPDWLPAGESCFSMDSSSALQAVAVLESIVFALQRNLDCLAVVQPCKKIIVSGGLSTLGIFCQRISDLAEKPVWRSDDVEACARGAAMQLLPKTAGQQKYHHYMPQVNLHLKQRYTQWSTAMDQLARPV